MKRSSFLERRRDAVGPVVGAGLFVVFAAAHIVNASALDRELALLDAGTGESLFERLGSAALAIAVGAATYFAWTRRSARLWLLAALLAFLLIDDIFGVHEHVPAWRFAYLPLLALIFALLWPLSGGVRAGLVLLALSFVVGVAAERLVANRAWGPGDPGYEAKILVKDGAEVAGWIMIAASMLVTLEPRPRR